MLHPPCSNVIFARNFAGSRRLHKFDSTLVDSSTNTMGTSYSNLNKEFYNVFKAGSFLDPENDQGEKNLMVTEVGDGDGNEGVQACPYELLRTTFTLPKL